MSTLRLVWCVCVLAATMGPLLAAPVTRYDQRQEGKNNIHARVGSFIVLVIPSSGGDLGSSLLELLLLGQRQDGGSNVLQQLQHDQGSNVAGDILPKALPFDNNDVALKVDRIALSDLGLNGARSADLFTTVATKELIFPTVATSVPLKTLAPGREVDDYEVPSLDTAFDQMQKTKGPSVALKKGPFATLEKGPSVSLEKGPSDPVGKVKEISLEHQTKEVPVLDEKVKGPIVLLEKKDPSFPLKNRPSAHLETEKGPYALLDNKGPSASLETEKGPDVSLADDSNGKKVKAISRSKERNLVDERVKLLSEDIEICAPHQRRDDHGNCETILPEHRNGSHKFSGGLTPEILSFGLSPASD